MLRELKSYLQDQFHFYNLEGLPLVSFFFLLKVFYFTKISMMAQTGTFHSHFLLWVSCMMMFDVVIAQNILLNRIIIFDRENLLSFVFSASK